MILLLQLYLGGKVDAKSQSTLVQRNVLRILNVTPAKEAGITAGVPNYFENKSSMGMKYKRISVYDSTTSDLLPFAEEIVQFISNGLHHGSVLVHCQRGVSRSATSVIMFLMRKANMTMEQSLQLCKRRRPVVDPNSAFMDQLRAYEKDCREWGHLTAVDGKPKKVSKVNGRESGGGDRDKKFPCNNGKDRGMSSGGDKRGAGENRGHGDEKKKQRTVGPMGPPRGPVGPNMLPNGPVRYAAIGPAMGPTTQSKDSAYDNSKDANGVKVNDRKVDKKVVGPMSRPSP